jgi:hypothetical protein
MASWEAVQHENLYDSQFYCVTNRRSVTEVYGGPYFGRRWWLSSKDSLHIVTVGFTMKDRQVSKKCIPSGGIIHVVPFFNSPIVLTEFVLCWDFLDSPAPPLPASRPQRAERPVFCAPHPFVGVLATLLLVCTLLKISVINGDLQQLVELP